MREIRDTHKLHSTERIAVMAALNLAHEFRRSRAAAKGSDESTKVDASSARRRISSMRSAIDQALSGQEKLL
jgi:cell division protein ZapA